MSCLFLFLFCFVQIRAIKEELGDDDEDEDDVLALEKKMQSAGMPPNVWKQAQRELRCLLTSLTSNFSMVLRNFEAGRTAIEMVTNT